MNDTSKPVRTADSRSIARPKVPAFARYEGTSVWRSDRKRVKAYAMHKAALAKTSETAGA